MVTRKRLLMILRLSVTLIILALLWQAVDGQAALDLLLRADPLWLVAGVITLTAQTVLSALRWRLTANRLGQTIAVGHALREYYLSQIVNQSLPGGVLGDAGRAVRARHEAGLKRSGQAVMFERLAGQLALFFVTCLAVAVVWLSPGGITLPDWVLRLVALTGLAMLVLLGGLWALSGGTTATQRQIGDWLSAFRLAVLSPSVLPRQAMLSIGTTALNLSAFALCARATGTAMPVTAVLIVVPLILFTMLIPISISGWGLREGAAATLFPVFGATATEGFAASLAFGLMFLLSTLPGLLVLLVRQPANVAKSDSVSG